MESGVLSAWQQHEVPYDLVAQSSDLVSPSSLIYDYVIERYLGSNQLKKSDFASNLVI